MRITPLDIRKQEFRRVMRGLDTEEVQAFLTTIADEYEAVLNDNKALKERLLELDDKVQEYRNMEKTLRNTLLTAERVNAEAKENARREAGLIIKEAEIEAEKTLRNIRNDQAVLRNSVQELKRQKESYISRIKMVAEAHLKFIESAEHDMQDIDIAVDSIPADTGVQREPVTKPDVAPDPFDPVEASVEEPLPAEENAFQPIPADAGLPEIPAEEEASLFPRIPEMPAGEPVEEAAAPATGEGDSESVPDLNEVLEKLETSRQERVSQPVSPAPESPVEPAPVTDETLAPADHAPPPPVAADAAPAAPSNNAGEEWSLERLKRDILSGASDQHEKT